MTLFCEYFGQGQYSSSNLSCCPNYVNDNSCIKNNLLNGMKKIGFNLSFEDLSIDLSKDQLLMGRTAQVLPRGILKKSVSADSVAIRSLRETIILSEKIEMKESKSDPDISFDIENNSLAPPLSPRSVAKNVTFADDNNLSLVEIRNFVPSSDTLQQYSTSGTVFRLSRLKCDNELSSSVNAKIIKRPVELLLCFKEPCNSPDFTHKFQQRCVALEKCGIRDRTVTGIILVKNIEFEKHVSVRYTMDRWKTCNEAVANYVPNSSNRDTDRFSFSVSVPKSSKEMEFAICYKTSTSEFWDNNDFRNFKVKDAMEP